MTVDLLEQTLTQLVLFQQMTEVQDRRLVRQRARQPQTYEPSQRLDLVEHILHTRITKVVEQLHAVYSQHRRKFIRPPAPARLGIERADALFEPFPRDQAVHALEENLPTGLALLAVVFQVRKCWLVHRILHPKHLFDTYGTVLCHNPPDLFRVSLGIGLLLVAATILGPILAVVVGNCISNGG